MAAEKVATAQDRLTMDYSVPVVTRPAKGRTVKGVPAKPATNKPKVNTG